MEGRNLNVKLFYPMKLFNRGCQHKFSLLVSCVCRIYNTLHRIAYFWIVNTNPPGSTLVKID